MWHHGCVHFTYELCNQIPYLANIYVSQNMMIQSGHHFIHVTTTKWSSHVQNLPPDNNYTSHLVYFCHWLFCLPTLVMYAVVDTKCHRSIWSAWWLSQMWMFFHHWPGKVKLLTSCDSLTLIWGNEYRGCGIIRRMEKYCIWKIYIIVIVVEIAYKRSSNNSLLMHQQLWVKR